MADEPAVTATPSRWLRGLGWVVAVGFGLVAVALLLLSVVTVVHTWHPWLIAAATFIPFLWVPTLLCLLGLVLALTHWRRWVALGLLVALGAYWSFPLWPLPRPQIDATPAERGIGVLAVNMQYGNGDLAAIATRVNDWVDVIVFIEHTPELEAEFLASDLAAEFPHAQGTIRTDAGGTRFFSRTPLEVVEALDTPFDNIVVRTTVAETEWLVAGIHAAPPQLGADAWARDGELVADLVERHLDERMLLVGDFNAIDQHHTMRGVVDAGAVNTASTRLWGETWDPTWPVGHPWIPAFARIDHYLMTPSVNGWAPTYFEVDGTDHMGILATAPKPLA